MTNPKYVPPASAKPLDLSDSQKKIEWAKKKIDKLDAERVSFLGTNTYRGVPKFNPETNRTHFFLENVPPVPDDIPLLIGDAAHNLRVALDYLACETVRSVGLEPKRVYFPIFESRKRYEAESAGQTKGMPKEAKDFIDMLRPYQGGNDYLWVVHEIDRIDKHRLLPTATIKVGGWSVTLDTTSREYTFGFSGALKTGDEIGYLEGNHEADKQMSITPDIAFGEPEILAGEAVFPTIKLMAKIVGEVISCFIRDVV